jgi:hypothetical protein
MAERYTFKTVDLMSMTDCMSFSVATSNSDEVLSTIIEDIVARFQPALATVDSKI